MLTWDGSSLRGWGARTEERELGFGVGESGWRGPLNLAEKWLGFQAFTLFLPRARSGGGASMSPGTHVFCRGHGPGTGEMSTCVDSEVQGHQQPEALRAAPFGHLGPLHVSRGGWCCCCFQDEPHSLMTDLVHFSTNPLKWLLLIRINLFVEQSCGISFMPRSWNNTHYLLPLEHNIRTALGQEC